MIAEFAVENFLSIRSPQKISFEPSSDKSMADVYTCQVKDGVRLLKIGIIYGANAAGKTNILSAIEFFRRLVQRMPKNRNERTGVVPFLLDEGSRNKHTKMSMTFYLKESKHILSFELDAKCIYSEKLIAYDSGRPVKLYSRSYDATTDSTTIEFGANLKLAKKSRNIISGNTINNCSVLAAFGKSNVERTRLNDVYDYFAKQIKEVLTPRKMLSRYVITHLDRDESGDLKRFILSFLKASDFNIENVVLHKGEQLITPELVFTHNAGGKLYSLPEKYESNGTMRFLGMAVILNSLLKEKQFIPIDEVETSIHYELLAYFIKVFLANSRQTSQQLLTTHDINLLNDEFIRRDTIWFTDKDEQGETQIARLSSLGLHKNLSPYNAYKQGKLVKLPFLGSLYFNLND